MRALVAGTGIAVALGLGLALGRSESEAGPSPRARVDPAPAVAAASLAPVPAGRVGVDDFALLDHEGRYRRLSEQADARAIVLFVQGNGCPIVRRSIPVLEGLRAGFEPEGVVFWGLNANLQDDRDEVVAEAHEYGIGFPILMDDAQLVAEALGVTRTAEAILIEPRSRSILFRGPIDDRLDSESQKPASRHFLREALVAHRAGDPVQIEAPASPGCLVALPHADRGEHAEISYATDVAPILLNRCRTCHTPDGVAPWAMTDHATVAGWSPMMREVVRTRRMPPFHSDPTVSEIVGQAHLTTDEKRTLIHWIEAGALRGDGPDPLAETPFEPVETWPLGPPDLILSAPRQDLPATGLLPYRNPIVPIGNDRDLWIRGASFWPGNRQSVHHAGPYVRSSRTLRVRHIEGHPYMRGKLPAYVPGSTGWLAPAGGALRLPRQSRMRFQMHYVTTGRPEVDESRLGLYLSTEPPEFEMIVGGAINLDIEIPAGAPDHVETAVHEVGRDIIIHSLIPHMHYRGRWARIEVERPGGSLQTLVSIPRYDFNWQREYDLAEPAFVPRGSRVRIRAGFDNSARNPANPDPTRTVRWGEQSTDEMLIGYFVYRDAGPDESRLPR